MFDCVYDWALLCYGQRQALGSNRKAYDLLTSGIADYHANSAEEALEQAYAARRKR